MNKRGSPFNWPLVLACVTTFLMTGILESGVLRMTGGVFMYPLDDPFIHMQIARNLAFHGTWGINPGEFASASSSLLYTLLLSGLFKVFTAGVAIPFIINCITAVALLIVLDRWLQRQGAGPRGRSWILLLVVFIVPLPVLIISGMEHTLQCLFTFLFITALGEWLEKGAVSRRGLFWLLLYAILITAIRYEGLFLVAIACLILAFHSRWKAAFLLGAAGLLPVIIFGLYSLGKGSYFLPNSVLVKSESIPFSVGGMITFLNNILVNKWTVVKAQVKVPGVPPPGISLLAAQRLLLLLPLGALLFRKQLREQVALRVFFLLMTGGVLLHLALAATGWLYRYEAYLVMNVTMVIALLAYRWGRTVVADTNALERGYAWLLAFAVFFPFVLRGAAAYSNIRQACVNIYQQQYQMAQFLKKYYDHDVVAANDIGAISYYSDIHMVDLWGLGDIDVARSRKKGYWTAAFLDSLARKRGVKLAIVYDDWFDPALTSGWKKVATWKVDNNVILGGDTVSFYAVGENSSEPLSENLHAFQHLLPVGVTVNYQ